LQEHSAARPASGVTDTLAPTSSRNLLKNHQPLCLNEVSCLQSVEVHSTRKVRTLPAGQAGVKLDLVNSRVPSVIQEHEHLPTKHVIHRQAHMDRQRNNIETPHSLIGHSTTTMG
jgi:hypothetical protein